MMNGLSILIPTYNDECLTLVTHLQRQCTESRLKDYEIIVADDGSTDKQIVETNGGIGEIAYCTYLIADKNKGRASIRNILAGKAKYDTLLFVDSDMSIVRRDFISTYISYHKQYPEDVIYGGYEVANINDRSNLRWKYEWECRALHTVSKRKERPYHDFHTSNFLIPRSTMLSYPFDERFRHYGYEDVFFGKQLQRAGVSIRHIDNPIGFSRFEDNISFIRKTDEGISTLHEFRNELKGYSHLLSAIEIIRKLHLAPLVKMATKMMHHILYANLKGKCPSLYAFKWYKLGRYLNME